MRTIEFHGIRATDPSGRIGLRNPERGWRTEALIAEACEPHPYYAPAHLRGKVLPRGDENWLLDAQRFAPYGLTIVQSYCYLTNFLGARVSDEKLEALSRSLACFRRHGLKALLRFGYERNMTPTAGPTVDDILRHMDQLAPVIRANVDVIYVLQAGFVGAWGEWHSSFNHLEQDTGAMTAILQKLLEILPAERSTQVRVPTYKRWVLGYGDDYPLLTATTAHTSSPSARIGYHNDGFLANEHDGGTWWNPPLNARPGNPYFDQVTDESLFVPIDAELFWMDQEGAVDGLHAIERMRLHHNDTFSLAHSYSEREGANYMMDNWHRQPLTRAQAEEMHLPYGDGFFENNYGDEVIRTQFEYMTDHLGYRFELQRAKIPEQVSAGGQLHLAAELMNRGCSGCVNERPVYWILRGVDGQVHALPTEADPRTWYPHAPGDLTYRPIAHTVALDTTLPSAIKPGCYQVGLWLPDAASSLRDDARYATQFANRDILWLDGLNILGVLEVTG